MSLPCSPVLRRPTALRRTISVALALGLGQLGCRTRLVDIAGVDGLGAPDASVDAAVVCPATSAPHRWVSVDGGVTPFALSSVWSNGPHDVYAVGIDGIIVHGDGQVFHVEPWGGDFGLQGVWGSDRDNVYAVGISGTILRRRGGSWTRLPSATQATLSAIWGSGADDIYIGASGEPTLLHASDGVSWSAIRSSAPAGARALWGSGPGDVYAVGAQFIAHGSGKSFDVTSFPGLDFRGVWGAASDDVYAGFVDDTSRSSGIWHLDGTEWHPEPVPTLDVPFRAIWGSGRCDLFVVEGEQWGTGPHGSIRHSSDRGASWTEEYSGTPLSAISGSSLAEIYAVGQGGTILHRQ